MNYKVMTKLFVWFLCINDD